MENSNVKTEPVFSELEKNTKIKNEEDDITEEFSGTNIDEDFNQEVQEELLDIPTFLRRQAN